jgi:hypothetical protein
MIGQQDIPQDLREYLSFRVRVGNVIRYNDIVSTESHGFNDAIGGSRNIRMLGI